MNLHDLGHFARASQRCRIRDVHHLKERLIEKWRHFDHDIIDRAINGGSDCEGVSVRTEDTFNINFKRWDCYHLLG